MATATSLLVNPSLLLIFFCQPLQALEHPAFKKMIDTSARATKGVKTPNRKQTRLDIITLFRNQMKRLKDRLNVRLFQKIGSDSYY
jgi:hypothetical protein